jgi:hypothetical protein
MRKLARVLALIEYFEERVPTADATYRVSVSWIEWGGGGGAQ